MNKAIDQELSSSKFDLIFMAAAVSDYSPTKYSKEKIKSKNKKQNLELNKTVDIMAETISQYTGIKIAFSLETQNGEKNAIDKMKSKKSDYIILNYANEEGAGFNHDTNHVYIYSKDGKSKEHLMNTKLKNRLIVESSFPGTLALLLEGPEEAGKLISTAQKAFDV